MTVYTIGDRCTQININLNLVTFSALYFGSQGVKVIGVKYIVMSMILYVKRQILSNKEYLYYHCHYVLIVVLECLTLFYENKVSKCLVLFIVMKQLHDKTN